jgi:hypothetical protein
MKTVGRITLHAPAAIVLPDLKFHRGRNQASVFERPLGYDLNAVYVCNSVQLEFEDLPSTVMLLPRVDEVEGTVVGPNPGA